jgi:hypothetical protein
MNHDHLLRVALSCCLLSALNPAACAQSSSSSKTAPQTSTAAENEGIESGNYRVQQSIEMGYRFTDTSGSDAVYNTFVNLQSGPRILEQSLSMRTLEHTGALFDSLSVSSFGWGGDPNDAARLRASKFKWYDVNTSFRRDQNYFDYDLFANPLNPPGLNSGITVNQSPHSFYTVRKMGNVDLTVLPQSRVTFRFGYWRTGVSGPSFSSLHTGTDALLYQPWDVSSDSYRFGGTVKTEDRKSSLSFDQFLQYSRDDRDRGLAPFATFPLPNGSPVELGLPWNTAAGQPCATPLVGGFAFPRCNGYFGYSRVQRARATAPSSQLSFVTRSIPRLDLVGRVGYSWADLNSPLLEMFNGRESRTNLRQSISKSSSSSRSITTTVESGATFRVTEKFHISDTFRFNNFRIPGAFALSQNDFFGSSLLATLAVFPDKTPTHSSSSGPDILSELFNRFLGQNEKVNEFDVEYDFSARVGARVGYRFRHRLVHHSVLATALVNVFFPSRPNRGQCAGLPLNPDGSCTFTGELDSGDNLTETNEHAGIIGLWLRPLDNLRLSVDADFTSADNILVRIDPRHQRQYRANANYTPRPWLTLGAALNLLERRDPLSEIQFNGHNRNLGLTAMYARNERFGLDFDYNYNNYSQNENICFIGTFVPPGSSTCPEDSALLQTFGFYHNITHSGSASVRFQPVKRVTTHVGYGIVSTNGSTLILDPLQPVGPLSFNYHRPLAGVEVNLARHVDGIFGWNYYDYDERSLVGPTLPRKFHSNLATISARYSF